MVRWKSAAGPHREVLGPAPNRWFDDAAEEGFQPNPFQKLRADVCRKAVFLLLITCVTTVDS